MPRPRSKAPLEISRRDFLNATMLGAGAALIKAPAPAAADWQTLQVGPAWYGYGGVGDYAPSHGNTPEVVNRAHDIRDGRYKQSQTQVVETGETYDVVVVGAGMAGLGAALEFGKKRNPEQRCLMIENHPIFGGESKRNEFVVNGERLIGPQGANGFSVPTPTVSGAEYAAGDARYYEELRIPREFEYRPWTNESRPLRFGSDNYGFLYWLEHTASMGYHVDQKSAPSDGQWVRDPWQKELADMPYSKAERKDLLTWRSTDRKYRDDDVDRWLDSMSYRDYIETVMGLSPAVTAYADPILAGAVGLGCDAVSAYAAYGILLPGVNAYVAPEVRDFTTFSRHSFPGGNDGFARHFVKRIIPGAIEGDGSFEAILNGQVNFAALDRPDMPVRMRLDSTVVSVEHAGSGSQQVRVTYVRRNRLYRVTARAVVMATGGWVNKYVVKDLPQAHQAAFASMTHVPFLVANVALTNWRFLYNLGITACRWSGGFGFSCNIRNPMQVGDYRPPLDPDHPIVLSFYVPYYYPGQPAQTQAVLGRTELLTTSFADYERRIIAQMTKLFGEGGFDAEKDVAGIILNRWGHAYVVPTPGFFFGRDGTSAARDVIREPFERISFGHSELHGNQHWGPAAEEGRRAMLQALDAI